jgi:nifR3 family TIM-barrel protein
MLRIGSLTLATPVVLAPMAGVTDPPFRTLCRRFMADGLYVSEMVAARGLVEGHRRTEQRVAFWPGEVPRSVQLYGTDAWAVGEAVRILVERDGADHVDLNLGCPAAKVTRHGGGAALPYKRRLVAAILRAAVEAAAPAGVPVTVKTRIGLDDDRVTFLDVGRIARDSGVAAIALHARTAAQWYSGQANWDRIAELKAAVDGIPVLGNGDIWEATDALAMVAATGCDGVVVGRGCLGRPWLFAQLAQAFRGEAVRPEPLLGEVLDLMGVHARLLVAFDPAVGIKRFRKHTGWYLTGFPVGGEVRRRLNQVDSLDHLDALLGALPRDLAPVAGSGAIRRGHTMGPQVPVVPEGWYDDPDEELGGLDDDAALAVSGG